MTRACISAILLVAITACNSQTGKYFEGKITYRFDLVSGNEKVDSSLKRVFGNGSVLTFKQGSYHHKYIGGLIEFDIYNREDNKAYIKTRGNDTIFWFDCGRGGDKPKKFQFAAKKEKVLGILCDELVIKYEDKTESQYYNADSIAIDPGWFARFKRDDENVIDEKEKSIYLKSKTDYGDFLFIETATKVGREAVDSKVFKIPANAILSEQKK
jgi:hypothetical protein